MSLTDKRAEGIAKELIREIASEWIARPGTRCLKKGDSYIFEFTFDPTDVVRAARLIKRPASVSIIRFNPLAEATEIVLGQAYKLEPLAGDIDSLIRNEAKAYIRQLLISAPKVFREASWQARVIAETQRDLEGMRVVGRPDIARGLLKSTLNLIQGRVRKHFVRISNARNPKINQQSIAKAFESFAPKFKDTGEIPSQRQFAKALGVTPKGWRSFLASHHMEKHEVTMKQWYEYLLAVDPKRWD